MERSRKHIPRRAAGLWLAAFLVGSAGAAPEPFAKLEPASAAAGYLARLLINETPFPGERGYLSMEDSQATMLSILWVLHARMHHVPPGYKQEEIAASRSRNVVDVITAKNQCAGFFKDAAGNPATAPRVEERLRNLLRIANGGGQPGRFAGLLNYAQGLATAYRKDGIHGADRFATLTIVDKVPVTGRAYAWMANQDYYRPGGNFVTIPDALQGSLGGNRFYTLRKEPR